MNILYIGPLELGGTCYQRYQALESLGHNVIGIDTGNHLKRSIFTKTKDRIKSKIFNQSDLTQANARMLEVITSSQQNIVWIDKGLSILSDTLLNIKEINSKIILISYSPDDMMNPNNQSLEYLKSIPIYDHHITTKSYNVKELQDLGAKNVIMMDNSFSELLHHPYEIALKDKNILGGSVGFIGFWERERESTLTYLAENGINVRIWGPWPKFRKYNKRLKVEGRALWGMEYAKAICSFDINLCFLRKINRDLQTTRSIEIPACGGFMLAERSDEHKKLFTEGKEAEYFSSDEELFEKTKYFISNVGKRILIAKNGLLRCHTDGYSSKERIKKIIDSISNLNENGQSHVK
ncbi:MAG: glycosyltransferase [Bacteroidota bacterium]